jgi:hypothetical protein
VRILLGLELDLERGRIIPLLAGAQSDVWQSADISSSKLASTGMAGSILPLVLPQPAGLILVVS